MRSFITMSALTAVALATALGATAVAKDKYEVAVIRWSPDDIYFNGVQLGQEIERKRLMEEEGVEIEFRVFGANDVSEQRNGLDAQIARGVDGVLLVPWRGEAMRNVVSDLREQKIPVVTSNAWVPQAPQTFVAFANEDAGRLGGEAIVSRLNELRGEDWPSKGGVIIELRCIITASFDIGRHTGYHSVLGPLADANENLVIETREAGCDGGKARKAVDDIISRYGEDKILAVASIDGTMGVGGAVPAFKAQGMLHPLDDPKHIPITTVDGTTPELQAIARGHIDHASVQPAIGEGVMTMRLLYEMMSTGTIQGRPDAEILIEGDALWMPISVIPSEEFDGAWYRTTTYTVPGTVAFDDKRIWSNQMYMGQNNGAMPDFGN